MINNTVIKNIFRTTIFVWVFHSGAHAATLNIADSPLYLATDTPANVFFEIDDSGSMDWDILTVKYYYYTSYWHSNNFELVTHGRWRAYSGSGSCGGRINYVYFFDNSDDAYNSCSYPTAEQNTETYVRDWRIRSADFNVLYYDPSKTYTPWPGFANASFTAVRSDPQPGAHGYNVTRNLSGFIYQQWSDTRGFSGSNPNGPTTATNGANGWVDLWDDHKTTVVNATTLSQTSYSFPITSTSTDCSLTHAQETPAYFSCYQTTSTSSTIAATGTDEFGRTPAEVQQNIANWYQYYRRRSFVAKAAVGQVISDSPNYRYGLSVINDSYDGYSGIFVQVPSSTDYTTHNAGLLNSFYSYNWPAKGTPLRHGLERVGKYFSADLTGKTDPIVSSCQHNFSILMTDGYWNGNNPSTPGIGDNDGDGNYPTVADVAKYFYDTDLSSLADEVPTGTFDTQNQQHLVTFTVAFGVEGSLTDTDNDGWPDDGGVQLVENSNWGNPGTSTPAKIDDLWHAAYNSRGEFISAKTPSVLIQALQNAIATITNRVSSASAVALSSGSWNTDTHIFQAKFDPSNWSGQLLAYPVSSHGALGTSVWEAGAKLDSQDYDSGRVILTYDTADNK
ncbi:MAG TPA: hypothetical protein DCZ03_05745, partial [Gammaproteobacteria bacterium]|nr:hypothetical protein [Gammaproteobacteria bacterium]